MITQKACFIKVLSKTGLLPVLSFLDIYSLLRCIDVCYATGIRVIELRDTLNKKAINLFPEVIRHCHQYPDLIVGVHSISGKNAAQYCKGGAAFISSSFLRDDMAQMALKFNTDWIPSCNSFEDIQHAYDLNANVVSLLPGNYLPSDVHMLKSQFPDMHFIPSTGVVMNTKALTNWVRAGVLCIRMNERLFPYEDVAVKDWIKIERRVLQALSTVKSLRINENLHDYSFV